MGDRGPAASPAECVELHPLIDADRVLGGFHTPADGLAKAVRAVEAQAARAIARGARFVPHTEVVGIVETGGRVAGVRTTDGVVDADIVVCAAGFWGAQLAKEVGLVVPLVPMAHQYARTGQIAALVGRNTELSEAGLPILRHQDQDLYFREHVDRLGIGSYSHRPMPVDMSTLMADTAGEPCRRCCRSPRRTSRPPGRRPPNSFRRSGIPRSRRRSTASSRSPPTASRSWVSIATCAGFWVAEAVWVTHSAGVAKAIAEWIVDGAPVDRCARMRPVPVRGRGPQPRVHHADQLAGLRRGLRHHPSATSSVTRCAACAPARSTTGKASSAPSSTKVRAGNARAWFEANAELAQRLRGDGLAFPERDDWSSRFWSPISIAEAHWTRERVAMYDMTPLTRYEVAGPGAAAFLQRMTTNNVDKSVGSVTYTMLLDENGGIRSDITVARLGEDRFQVAVNGPMDFDWLHRHLPDDVDAARHHRRHLLHRRVGAAGPRHGGSRCVPTTCRTRSSSTSAHCRRYLGAIPVTMLRVSYVGELGWEIYTSAEYGAALWDLLFERASPHEVIAAGRIAFNSLRIEKGYRLWGTDMTAEHQPVSRGRGFRGPDEQGRLHRQGRRWSARPHRRTAAQHRASTIRPPSRSARNRSSSMTGASAT